MFIYHTNNYLFTAIILCFLGISASFDVCWAQGRRNIWQFPFKRQGGRRQKPERKHPETILEHRIWTSRLVGIWCILVFFEMYKPKNQKSPPKKNISQNYVSSILGWICVIIIHIRKSWFWGLTDPLVASPFRSTPEMPRTMWVLPS